MYILRSIRSKKTWSQVYAAQDQLHVLHVLKYAVKLYEFSVVHFNHVYQRGKQFNLDMSQGHDNQLFVYPLEIKVQIHVHTCSRTTTHSCTEVLLQLTTWFYANTQQHIVWVWVLKHVYLQKIKCIVNKQRNSVCKQWLSTSITSTMCKALPDDRQPWEGKNKNLLRRIQCMPHGSTAFKLVQLPQHKETNQKLTDSRTQR